MVRTVASTCWECASKCGSLITVEVDGRVSKIVPRAPSASRVCERFPNGPTILIDRPIRCGA